MKYYPRSEEDSLSYRIAKRWLEDAEDIVKMGKKPALLSKLIKDSNWLNGHIYEWEHEKYGNDPSDPEDGVFLSKASARRVGRESLRDARKLLATGKYPKLLEYLKNRTASRVASRFEASTSGFRAMVKKFPIGSSVAAVGQGRNGPRRTAYGEVVGHVQHSNAQGGVVKVRWENGSVGRHGPIGLERLASRKGSMSCEASASGFMSDYYGKTHDNIIQPEMRVWSFAKDGERLPLIMTEMESRNWDGRKTIWFKAIISPEKQGTGMASYVLKQIVKLADKHQVPIYLTPKPFGRTENALSASKLKSWYKRNGWEDTGRGTMLREPQ